MMKMNGAQVVIASLRKEKVEVVFGYPGGTVLSLYDKLYEAKFPHILTGHEQGAVHAADGYARSTGRVGVCFATSGPGICNMVSGIATANMDSIPLVVISGQVATNLIGRDSFQEADISGITTPITKHNFLVKDVQELPRVLKEAFYIATTGRPGPVLVDIAKDVFDKEVDYTYPETVHLRGYSGVNIGRTADIAVAVAALATARKPVLLTGGGVILSDTSAMLRQITAKLGIPVVTTLMGKGAVPDTYATHLGMVGMHGSYAANMAVTNCDLLLAIGARFDDRVTGDVENFAPHAKIVHFDIDKVEINKIVHADISVNGDLRWSLPLFAQEIMSSSTNFAANYEAWRTEVETMKAEHPFRNRQLPEQVSPEQIFAGVSKCVPQDAIIVTDVGQHQMWTAQFFNIDNPRSFITSGGLGTMGFGLPAALGAKVAHPDKTVVLFTGDGSIMMNVQEFATLAKYGIEVKVIVLHNTVLGMVHQWQQLFYNEHYSQSVLKDNPNLPAISTAMGVPGFTVHKPAALEEGLKQLFEHKGSALLDVFIPEDEGVYPMVPGGKRLDEMILGDEKK